MGCIKIIRLTENDLKNVIKESVNKIIKESYGDKIIKSPKLYKALALNGINDILLVKGDGYFYLYSDKDDVYYNVISKIENNFIPCYSFSQQSIEEWVDSIKSLLNDVVI